MLADPETINQSVEIANAIISPNIVWFFFALAFIGFIGYSAVLLYHWFHYASDTPMMWPVMITYFSVSTILLFILFFSALAIST